MILLRFFVLAFNVAVIAFLIFEMIRIGKERMERTRKIVIITGGVILLLVPFGMFFRILPPSMPYFLIYPVAIALYIYLIRRL
jgi:O-antigen/teichoic acid export membrane protein